MGIVLVCVKKVVRIGRSLSFILPSSFARHLSVSSSTFFYVFCSNEGIVYSLEPPEDMDYLSVKSRVQARVKGHEYYVLTIPHAYASRLGISEGDEILVKLEGRRIVLNQIKGVGRVVSG